MADAVRVELRGIDELASAFKQVTGELPKALKTRFLNITETIATVARGKMPRVSGDAAGSVQVKASPLGGTIVFGGPGAEHTPWLNFGGDVGRNNSIHRPIVKPDRYIYSTISEQKDETAEAASRAIQEVAEDAGFQTTGF